MIHFLKKKFNVFNKNYSHNKLKLKNVKLYNYIIIKLYNI